MTDEYALRLAEKWAQGYVCSLRDGEAQEYHKACAVALREREERGKRMEGFITHWMPLSEPPKEVQHEPKD